MRAAVTTDSHGFEVVELPDPTPEPDQLVIRVKACGVCGSDIKAQPFAPAGMVMGHELGGEIVAVGSDTEGWREGTNVAVLPVISCGSCQYCRAGLVPHCPQASYIGMGPAGGFAEYAAVPARHCFAMPRGLPAAYSALVEPFAVGLHGVHSAEVGAGRRRAHRRRGRRRSDDPYLGAAQGRRTRHSGRSRRAAARLSEFGGRHRCARVCVRGRTWGLRRRRRMRRTSRACAGLPAGAAATGPPRRFRCLRRADHHRAHHRAPQGTHGPVLRRLLDRRIPQRSSPRSATGTSTRPRRSGRHSDWTASPTRSTPSVRHGCREGFR